MKNWRVSMYTIRDAENGNIIYPQYTTHGNMILNIYLKNLHIHNKSCINNIFWTIFSIVHDVCSVHTLLHAAEQTVKMRKK